MKRPNVSVDPTNRLLIRSVRLNDAEAAELIEQVQDFYVLVYGGPDTSPVEDDQFAAPHGQFFLGYLASQPIAMGGWRWYRGQLDLPASRPAEIKRMYVAAKARGHGFARQLLAHLEQTASAAGADALVLETGQPQPEAIGLYRSSGYVDIPSFGYYANAPLSVHLGKLLRAP
ncbi:MAG: GNAT family N-acetyltransferase [Nocardioidaceae bacterium]